MLIKALMREGARLTIPPSQLATGVIEKPMLLLHSMSLFLAPSDVTALNA